MKTCVVGFINRDNHANFKSLPLSFTAPVGEETVRFVIHDDPAYDYHENCIVRNYDLLIAPTAQSDGAIEELEKPDFRLCRYNKVEQSVIIEQIRRKLNPPNMIGVRSFNRNTTTPYDGFTIQPYKGLARYLVARPIHGARGMAVALIDTEYVNPLVFLRHLKHCDDVEQVKAFIEKHADHVIFSKGLGWHNDEFFTVISQEYQLTEYITGIRDECRIILNKDSKPALTEIRNRASLSVSDRVTEVQFLQPAQNSIALIDGYSIPRNAEKFEDEIYEVLKELPPMSSVDIFLTDRHWGIFEFCPEWSTMDFSIASIQSIMKDFIVKLYVDKYC